MIRIPVAQVTRWKALESTACGSKKDVKRARITGGETRKASAIATGTSSTSQRRQNQMR